MNQARRDLISPAILASIPGNFPYMMPRELLPIMDCPNCQWMKFMAPDEKAAGLHCYMFREKPEGDRCGQMKRIAAKHEQET